MRLLKTALFASVFALATIFTLNASGKSATTANDCWKPGNPDIGNPATADEDSRNCNAPNSSCCYVEDSPNHFSLLMKQTAQ